MRQKLLPLIAGIFLLLGVQSSLALTLSDVRTAIRRNVRDTASNSSLQRYSDSALTEIINEGQRQVILRTWLMNKTTLITLSPGTGNYVLPADTISIRRVRLDRAALPEVTREQIDADANYTSWELDQGTPIYWYRGNLSSLNEINVYPVPSSSGALRVAYASAPEDLSADSDVPFEGEDRFLEYHDVLVFYGSLRIFMMEGTGDRAALFSNLYENEITLMNENSGERPTQVPQVPVKERKQ